MFVKMLVDNQFAGADFQKLDIGAIYEVEDAIAKKWIADGKAVLSREAGVKLQFEVATPSVDDEAVALKTQLDEALAQIQQLKDAAKARQEKTEPETPQKKDK
ncbi:hypothetical protein PT300_13270 [Enterobacteriaceae bacterium ESL0689]|nr:hypothetical protein [Enterobacteriaceae bacterium ESL0689]